MSGTRLFTTLSKEEKISFFVKCQELLVQYHPQSKFITRQNNVIERIDYFKQIFPRYKGYIYQDDNVCATFNKIFIADNENVMQALKNNLYKEPAPEYNALSIDFVVFRSLEDCLNFVKLHYEPRISKVIFVKNNKPKIYKTDKLVARLAHIPIIS